MQHCRWSVKLGAKGAAPAHLSAASGGIEGSLKAAANEVFGFLSAAQEELTNSTSRSKVRGRSLTCVGMRKKRLPCTCVATGH